MAAFFCRCPFYRVRILTNQNRSLNIWIGINARWGRNISNPASSVHDNYTRKFWKNCQIIPNTDGELSCLNSGMFCNWWSTWLPQFSMMSGNRRETLATNYHMLACVIVWHSLGALNLALTQADEEHVLNDVGLSANLLLIPRTFCGVCVGGALFFFFFFFLGGGGGGGVWGYTVLRCPSVVCWGGEFSECRRSRCSALKQNVGEILINGFNKTFRICPK